MDGRLFSKKYRIDWSFLQIYKKLTDVSLENKENRFGMKKSGAVLHPPRPSLRVGREEQNFVLRREGQGFCLHQPSLRRSKMFITPCEARGLRTRKD